MTATPERSFSIVLLITIGAGLVACSKPRSVPLTTSGSTGGSIAPARSTGGQGGTATGGRTGAATGGQIGAATPPDAGGTSFPGIDDGKDAKAALCVPGLTRCAAVGAAVEICSPNGDWVVDRTCFSICDRGACAGMCMPGDKQCGLAHKPESCGADGQWAAAGDVCPFVCTGKGECTGDCRPGARRCGDPPNTLTPYVCNETGRWQGDAPCMNLCSSGSCGGSCSPGATRCTANRPETCSAAGTWEPGTECKAKACVDGACTGVCAPGDRQCSTDNAPQTCDERGNWVSGPRCTGQSCVAGSCRGNCEKGMRKCGANNAPQTCVDGTYKDEAPCVSQTCTNGTCAGSCAPGQRRCGANNNPQTCSNGAWKDEAACSGQTCMNGSCAGTCVADDRQCSNNTPQICKAGNWQNQPACVNKSCIDGACAGSCAPEQVSCGGNNNRQSCKNGAWQDLGVCKSQTCSEGKCMGVCAPGESACGGNATCKAGQYATATECPGHLVCSNFACTTACVSGYEKCGASACIPKCDQGCATSDSQCIANANGRWWYQGDFDPAHANLWMSADITQTANGNVAIVYNIINNSANPARGRFTNHNMIQMGPEADNAVGVVTGNPGTQLNWGGAIWTRKCKAGEPGCV